MAWAGAAVRGGGLHQRCAAVHCASVLADAIRGGGVHSIPAADALQAVLQGDSVPEFAFRQFLFASQARVLLKQHRLVEVRHLLARRSAIAATVTCV